MTAFFRLYNIALDTDTADQVCIALLCLSNTAITLSNATFIRQNNYRNREKPAKGGGKIYTVQSAHTQPKIPPFGDGRLLVEIPSKRSF